jgi:hypothetical protein
MHVRIAIVLTLRWGYDTQLKGTQYNDIQRNDTQHKGLI